MDVADKTVENPRKDNSQGLDVQLLKLKHQFLLSRRQQLLKQNAQT
jgi:hypothetical protein